MIRALLLVSLLAAYPLTALSQSDGCTSHVGRSVSVTGLGMLHLTPDRVSFSVGVETESPDVADAFRRNTEKVNAVLGAASDQHAHPRAARQQFEHERRRRQHLLEVVQDQQELEVA